MSRRRADVVAPDHLSVARPLRPDDLDRRVTCHGTYPSLPASPGVPWSTYVRSQKIGSRSVSSSTDALDSDQARLTTQRILQYMRSLPTDSPVPYIPSTDREYRSDSRLSDRYTVQTPMATGANRSTYKGYSIENEDYATVGNVTPTSSSAGMFVKPRNKTMSRHGSPMQKDNAKERAVFPGSRPIIGESATVFTDMTDTMLKVLDRRMAITANPRELENSLADSACAIDQPIQGMTGYLPDTDSYQTIPSQVFYMNTLSGTTGISVPVAESTPVPKVGPRLIRPIPFSRAHDILEPIASEQARAKYLDEQIRHMKGVQLPSSIPASDDIPLEEDDLSRRIRDYCLRIEDHRRCEKDTHYVTLNSIKEYKARQRQQCRKDSNKVYQKMSQNLEKVREVARNTFSRASTISAEEHRMNLSETDFINIKEKMNKIDQRIDGLYQNWQAEYREAITTKQCEEIQRFYEPYVQKYETKYEILYQTLQQAISDRSRVPSSRVTSRGLTPSLVALEDASTLKRKEWSQGEPSEDTHWMYTTIGGSLTPTAPVYGDMRTHLTLNVTSDVPTTVEGVGERESTQLSG